MTSRSTTIGRNSESFPGLVEGGKLYGVMTSFGYLGLTYNTEKLTPKDVTSYKVLWDEKVKGQVGMYDWYLPPMLCLSLYNGNRPPFDITDEQFAKLKATLLSLKDQMVGIGSFSGTFSMLSQGEAWAFVGTGAWLTTLLKKDGVPVADVIPEEGGIQWTEAMTLVKGSRNSELAIKFLQYMASPRGSGAHGDQAGLFRLDSVEGGLEVAQRGLSRVGRPAESIVWIPDAGPALGRVAAVDEPQLRGPQPGGRRSQPPLWSVADGVPGRHSVGQGRSDARRDFCVHSCIW